MEKYDWVNEILLIGTAGVWDNRLRGKIVTVTREFGEGFDRNPERGGFDELAARNYTLQLAYTDNYDWTLLLDADEFFLPETYDDLRRASDDGMQGIFFECYHAKTLDTFVWDPASLVNIKDKKMHDPHLRAVHRDLAAWYRLQPENLRREWTNRTLHCYIETAKVWHKLTTVLGPRHVHLKHLLPPKSQLYDLQQTRQLTINWPHEVVAAYRNFINENKNEG
jgi:hypothetical protein